MRKKFIPLALSALIFVLCFNAEAQRQRRRYS
jgi:hypothetical protein